MRRAEETREVVFFFFKARIVNYFGTDGSQSAIEFDYRLNGIHNERALI